jgi:hypothetical protein
MQNETAPRSRQTRTAEGTANGNLDRELVRRSRPLTSSNVLLIRLAAPRGIGAARVCASSAQHSEPVAHDAVS